MGIIIKEIDEYISRKDFLSSSELFHLKNMIKLNYMETKTLSTIREDYIFTYNPKVITGCKFCGIASFSHSHRKGEKPNEFVKTEDTIEERCEYEPDMEKIITTEERRGYGSGDGSGYGN